MKLRCLGTMFTLYRRTKEIELQEDAPLLALIMVPTTHSNEGILKKSVQTRVGCNIKHSKKKPT